MTSSSLRSMKTLAPGLIVVFSIAVAAWALVHVVGRLPAPIGTLPVSMMLIAILLGLVLAGQASERPGWQPGLALARGPLLKFAVALIGLRLSLVELGEIGLMALPLVAVIVVVGLLLTYSLARLFGTNRNLSILLATGTSICGASAIAATAPGLRARAEETSYAIACIALIGLAATLLYPYLLSPIIDNPLHIGLVMGAAIHDTAQVTAAAALYEQAWHAEGTLVAATVTKLLRNATMLVVIPLLVWLAARNDAGGTARVALPWFIVGFIALSGARTGGDWLFGAEQVLWLGLVEASTDFSIFVFAMAMAALAMNVRFSQLRELGWKPAAAALLAASGLLTIAIIWARFLGGAP